MNKKDLDALNELYLSVYGEEQLDEAPVTGNTFVDRILQGGQAFFQGKPRPTGTVNRQIQTAQQYRDAGGVGAPPPNWKPGQPTETNTPTATKTAATSPAAAAPRPTATAAAPKPAAAPAPAGPKPTATITPTPAAPKPEEGERALTKLPGGNYSSDATSMMSQRTKNILGTTKTPAARPMGSARERMLRQSFDPYDVIKGHLLDEGYADTEQAAEAIMVNMSEDWRESIVEGIVDKVASTAGSVVGTVQRAAREVPKYVQQKVNNVAGSYEYARQKADNNSSSGSTKMTVAKNATMRGKSSAPRGREFTNPPS